MEDEIELEAGADAPTAWLLAVTAGMTLVLLDVSLGKSLNVSGLLVLVPLIVASGAPARDVVWAGAATLAVGALLLAFDDVESAEFVVRLAVVVVGTVLGWFLAHQREQRATRLTEATQLAHVAQHLILSPPPARINDVLAAARYLPAAQTTAVGGDLYDLALSPTGNVRFIIGDVRGKGLEAIQLAALVLSSFRQAAVTYEHIDDLVTALDISVRHIAAFDDFVTVIAGELRPRELLLVNCGHPEGVRCTDDAATLLTPSLRTRPLGLRPEPNVDRFAFEPGDRLLWWTDGLVEARDRSRRFFDLDHHLGQVCGEPTVEGAVDLLVDAVIRHAGGALHDDLAVLGLQTVR